MILNINTFPIVILANYRTGSTALCYKIASDYNLKHFVEPHIDNVRKEKFLNFFKFPSKNFVIKFMPDQLHKFSFYETILNDECFKIKLTRKDKLKQIASYYIARQRNKWGTNIGEIENDYFVSIDYEEIDICINTILHVDKLLDEYKNIDIELTYEELGYIDDVEKTISKLPNNFDKLLLNINKKL